MRFQDRYDWLVLGMHPGALLTASMAAKLGFSVLVLPGSQLWEPHRRKMGEFFDPESNFLIGLGKEGLVFQTLLKLGLLPHEVSQIETQGCLPQVLTQQSRFLFSQDSFQEELEREYGEERVTCFGVSQALALTHQEFQDYWRCLPQRLSMQPDLPPFLLSFSNFQKKMAHLLKAKNPRLAVWSSQRRLAEQAWSCECPHFKEAFQGLYYGLTGHENSDSQLWDLLHILSISQTGGSFRGGMIAYRQLLLQLAKRCGVHLDVTQECRKLFLDRGRFVGIQVSHRGSMISIGGGVLGCSLKFAQKCILETYPQLQVRYKKPLKPSAWKWTLALTVNAEVIQPGMTRRMIWQEPYAPPLEWEMVPLSDYQENNEKQCLIYLRTLLPFELETLQPQYQQVLASRMFRQATQILPFLEYHVIHLFPDFRSEQSIVALYPFSSLEEIPENLLVYQGKGLGSTTGIDGLFIASDEAYPELGHLGPTRAAFESVAWLSQRSGFSGPLLA